MYRRRAVVLLLAVPLLWAVPAFRCPPAGAAEVILKNGDRVTGEYLGEDDHSVRLKSGALEIVSVRKQDIEPLDGRESIEPPEKSDAAPTRWEGEIEAGVDRQLGNTDRFEFSARLLLHRWTRHNEFHLKGDTRQSRTDGDQDALRHYGMVRYAFSFGSALHWYDFYRLEAEHDRFANVDLRVTPATGVGCWFSDTEPTKLLVELGVGAAWTDFREGDSATEGVWMPRFFLEESVFGNSRLSEDFILYAGFTGSGGYRFRSEAALNVPMNEDLSVRLTLLNEYTSDPGAEARKHDLHLVASLAYSFL